MPATIPTVQLFGSGFGHDGSTWNEGASPCCAGACATVTLSETTGAIPNTIAAT